MNRVLKFGDHSTSTDKAEEFINMILNPKINESSVSDDHINQILKKTLSDLSFNYGLIFTFGLGIRAMFPIVENLIKNGNIKIDLTPETVVLLCLASLSVTYLEEKKNRTGEKKIECQNCKGDNCQICGGSGTIDSVVTKGDVRTILEELKLNGVGNGIVKKIVKCFKSIGNILSILFKNTPVMIGSFMDMFGFTSLLIPITNAISSMVINYSLDVESLPGNFLSLGVGITTFLAKNGFSFLVKKLKSKLNIKINTDCENPAFIKSHDGEIKDGDVPDLGQNKLIVEQ